MTKGAQFEFRSKAKAMFQEGLSYAEIARSMNITSTTARCWVDPEYHKRRYEKTKLNRNLRRWNKETDPDT